MIGLIHEHPWMTFTLIFLALLVVESMVANFCKMLAHVDDKPVGKA